MRPEGPHNFHHTLLVDTVLSLPRFKEGDPDPTPAGGMDLPL